MKVYVLSDMENGEGGSVVLVCETQELAKAAAQVRSEAPLVWEGRHEGVVIEAPNGDGDYWLIEPFEVQR